MEGWLNKSVDGVDVTFALKLWGDSSMHAQVVTVDIGGDGHGFERVDELFIDVLLLEFLEDFASEGKVLSHGSGLVVAAQHDHLFREVKLHNR